ncbi:alpha-amylase family glycosyl hydrolase [Amphibacillus indicireducens]|uniref:Glycosyl hydrolase family 13 catalytic domain-containing protein n=1 Tax=Amphibacillus indicireducens TaxID=1076330 RepID=A0ABP7W0B4_9BACI
MNQKVSTNHLTVLSIIVILLVSSYINWLPIPIVDAQEKNSEAEITVEATVNRAFHYDQHGLLELEIDNDSDLEIVEIEADLTELGSTERLSISPELNRVTLSVRSDIEPGEKKIPINVVDENGGTYTTTAAATIIAREKTNDDRDWDEAVIYFMVTDRFADGDPKNNDPYGINYDEIDDNPRGAYQGGDFKGITDNLDYLAELGINTIWITPIVENVGHDVEFNSDAGAYYGYHGYWAKDFETLNPHLGSLEDFHELIDQAAARDIDIMVDVVLNHIGYGLKINDEQSEPPAGFPTNEDRNRFVDMIRDRSGAGDLKMELSGLPDFKTEEDWVREQIVAWQTAWLEKSTTPSGNSISSYRVDTVKHVDHVTWQHFKNELVAIDPNFKLIGEAWGANYQDDLGYHKTGTMDSLLDFGFKDHARHFVNGSLEEVNNQLIVRNQSISNIATLGQFLGSHDEAGFLHNLIESGDSEEVAQGKLKLAATLQITAKGQPVIYYGEELGQTGAENWPEYDNRYDFAWDMIEGNPILDHYQKLLEFRQAYSELLARADRSTLAGSNNAEWLVVERTYDDQSVYLGFNRADFEQEITLTVSNADVIVIDHYADQTYQATEDQAGNYVISLTAPKLTDGGTLLLTAENGTILSNQDNANSAETETSDSITKEPIENQSENANITIWPFIILISLTIAVITFIQIKRKK